MTGMAVALTPAPAMFLPDERLSLLHFVQPGKAWALTGLDVQTAGCAARQQPGWRASKTRPIPCGGQFAASLCR
jgi:hypothetical protein